MKYTIVLIVFLSSVTLRAANELPNHPQAIIGSFSTFLDNFMRLLAEKNNPAAKERLNDMLASLLTTAHQLTNTKKTIALDPTLDNPFVSTIDQELLDELCNLVTIQARMLIMIKLKQTSASIDAKQKADVQKILNCFAAVMHNFFTIVQEPENRQNVTQGVIGMLSNIIAAGKVIISDSNQNNGPNGSIEQMVDALDDTTKQQILNLIQSRRQCIRINTALAYN